MPRTARTTYIPTFRRLTAGGRVELDYNAVRNPTSNDVMYGITNYAWPGPIQDAAIPTTTLYLWAFQQEGSPYPYRNYQRALEAKWNAALATTGGLGWDAVQIANGGAGFDPIINTGSRGVSMVYATGAYARQRNSSYQAARTSLIDGLGAWIFAIPATTYSIPVCELLNEIQYHLMEEPNGGASFGSGLWSVPEVLVYLNNRISRFLMETGCIQIRSTQTALTGEVAYNLPGDLIDLRRVAWDDGAGNINVLPRGDSLQADSYYSDWDTTGTGTPQIHLQIPEESLEIRLAPEPAQNGTLEFIYVQDAPTVTNDCSIMPLPDEWVPFVKWGVIADMLAKEGEANDPKRSQFAEGRYTEGVTLARLYLGALI